MRLLSLDRDDFRQLTHWLGTADALVEPYSDGELLSGSSVHDLPLIQRVFDAGDARVLQPDTLQALAVALGRALLHAHDALDWAVAEVDRQREYVLHRTGTLQWVSPLGSLNAHLQTRSKPDAAQVLAEMARRLSPQVATA